MTVFNSIAYFGFPIKKEGDKKMVASKEQVKTGTITRTSKTGFQIDNVNQWYNPAIFGPTKYEGPNISSLDAGTKVEFTFIENVTAKGTYLNVLSLEVISGTSSVPVSDNGSKHLVDKITPFKNTQDQITKNVVAYAVFHSPVVAQMLSASKTFNDSVKRLSNIALVIERFLVTGQEDLSTLINGLVEKVNGSGKK